MLLTQDTILVSDELDYFGRGARLAKGRPIADVGARPPGTELAYSLLFRIFGISRVVARMGNVVLSSATIPIIYWLGQRMGGRRVALFAAGIAAIYPGFIAFSHYLWSETLYTFLVLGSLALTVSALEGSLHRKLVAAGILLGASALTREMGAVLAAALGLWLLSVHRTAPRRGVVAAALLGMACLLVVVPWSLQLSRHTGTLSFVSQTTYLNLYLGNGAPDPAPGQRRVKPREHYRTLGETRPEREALARVVVLRTIKNALPGWPLDKVRRQVPKFFSPNSFPVYRLLVPVDETGPDRVWAYRFAWQPLNRPLVRKLLAACVVGIYVLVVVSGIAGLVLAPNRRLAWLFVVVVLSQLLPTVIAFATTRFRLPCMPLFMIGTAVLLAEGRRLGPLRLGWPRLIAATVCAVGMLALVSLRYYSVLKPTWG